MPLEIHYGGGLTASAARSCKTTKKEQKRSRGCVAWQPFIARRLEHGFIDIDHNLNLRDDRLIGGSEKRLGHNGIREGSGRGRGGKGGGPKRQEMN